MAIAPDLCGTALDGRYELRELIGEGAFGCVYRGHDRRLDRAVAVKVIKPWWTEDPGWVAVFERETRLLARLNDPGIVQIHDVGQATEGLFYVSELVEGENLAQRLRETGARGLDGRQARRIALGLCRALAVAHARGIVHRDVKPANILLSGHGSHPLVKVADFGVARLAQGTSTTIGGQRPAAAVATSLTVGTPRYMAPEQGRDGPATPATDVYSVGVVLYEMLAGQPPFNGESPVALALSHLYDPPPPLPSTAGGELGRIVARALAKDPADRYRDAGAMAAALAIDGPGRIVAPPGRRPAAPAPAESTQPAPRLGPRRTVNPSARRRSAALLTLAGALLGAIVAAAVLSGDHHGSTARAAAAPVEVPLLVNESVGDARAGLRSLHLRIAVADVPAPGIRPGTVTRQRPVGGQTAAAHSVVALSVAEVPRWRTVTTFTGRSSIAFRIRGMRWRIQATASSTRRCTFLIFCHGSSAEVLRGSGGSSSLDRFGLGDGSAAPRVFSSGPGVYRVVVDPVSGATRWSIRVQDDF
jgi:hypothetical protein